MISPGELHVQLEEEGVAGPEVELSCTMNKLYDSLSETEMILEDPGMGCRVVSMKGASRTEPSSVTTPTSVNSSAALPLLICNARGS